ncbi:MAG: DNA alkylation repair protein [Gammaproteobacteria bacterium]|nr:MAG: DNA alkylation repair protein [Gammaproteobacteria bacterium]
MPEAFKNLYNENFYSILAQHLKGCLPDFDERSFMTLMLCENFEQLELKERMSHTTTVFHQFMPAGFKKATKIILSLIVSLKAKGIKEDSIEYMFLPEYLSTYGMEDLQTSIVTMEEVTQFTSGEFAVRPFLIKYGEVMLEQMILWSKHPHYLVRRLASEGSRPRLPWAMALGDYKKDPTPILPILHRLMDDPTEIVRRSVANNLNDIAKDNPHIVIEFAKQYLGKREQINRTIKHACRTLLKQGCPEILSLFGYDSTDIELIKFDVLTSKVAMGSAVEFAFTLKNKSLIAKKVRLEYGLYYMKKSGQLSKKVFKISERILAADEIHKVQRKQSFKAISTRVFHLGKHQVSIILNGKEFMTKDFELITAN